MLFKFLVAKNNIKGLPGLSAGDMVIRVAVEVMEGGYEYDVWRNLDDGSTAKTRIEHRDEFEERSVEGETYDDALEAIVELQRSILDAI